jgi:uncharacterized protein (TIGR02246 family)
MRLTQIAAVLIVAGGAALLSACAPSTEADESAIRAANKKWLEAIVAKDAKAVAALYAQDAHMMPPNAPKAVGQDAIEKTWAGLFGIPGMSLSFETDKFVFAKSADLAVDIGTYKFTAGEGAAAQTEIGKAVVTWTKRDGKWYVLTDMFSSDAPATAPAPATETPAPPATPEPEQADPATPPTP